MEPGIDFSYFNSAPLPYHGQFFNLPPTPQSGTPQLDDYRNSQNREHFDPAFAHFQQNFQYDPNHFVAQSQAQSVAARSPASLQLRTHSLSGHPDQSLDGSHPVGGELSPEDGQINVRSSSEEKDILTPQQNKRKAQNRAAQRAFRERKEKHVKDLETQNTTLQHEQISLQHEVDRLRRELAKVNTENEILRATSGSSANGPAPFLTEPDELIGPLGYTPTDYGSRLRDGESSSTWNPSAKWAQFGVMQTIAVDDDSGEPLLNAGATWDYIQAHELFKRGLVEIGDVCERLKKMARCDGQGPVFQESDIRRAISESAVAGGRDELI